jgi:hypothetical protein
MWTSLASAGFDLGWALETSPGEALGGSSEHPTGWCQTNANQSQFTPMRRISSHTEPTPLGKSGGAVSLKVVAAVSYRVAAAEWGRVKAIC